MNSKAVQFLEANQSGERSTFVDDAKWRQENASWLRRTRRVAYAIMDYMQAGGLSRNDVAEKLGVSPQYVSKILSGKVNFSFKTISEIEEGLGIELFQATIFWCFDAQTLPSYISVRIYPKIKKKRYLNYLLLDYLTNRWNPLLDKNRPRFILKCNITG